MVIIVNRSSLNFPRLNLNFTTKLVKILFWILCSKSLLNLDFQFRNLDFQFREKSRLFSSKQSFCHYVVIFYGLPPYSRMLHLSLDSHGIFVLGLCRVNQNIKILWKIQKCVQKIVEYSIIFCNFFMNFFIFIFLSVF